VFKQRARGSEFLDAPGGDPRLVEQSYRFMKLVNRIGGGIRVVREFFARELPNVPKGKLVRVLDLGSADCDIPIAIARWAKERGYNVEFTCLDHDPTATELARQAVARCHCDTIRVEQADIFHYQPAADFDYAMGSMFFHHFTNEEIHRLIALLQGFVRKALLVNDLHRCRLNYLVCYILTIPLDRRIQHDGLLSILRGFKPGELAQILREHDPAAVVRRFWFCRVSGVARFDRKGGQ